VSLVRLNGGSGQSKTANILYAKALAELYKDRGLSAYSLHPGMATPSLHIKLIAIRHDLDGFVDETGDSPD
jgi:NAD(P)-dependent dehydrogenase (short-subunit alcohol dehydrogenase family)